MDEKIIEVPFDNQLNLKKYENDTKPPKKHNPSKKLNLSSYKLQKEQSENLDQLIKRYLPKSPLKNDKKQNQIEYIDTLLKESEELIQKSQKTSIQPINKSLNGDIKQQEKDFNIPLDKNNELHLFEFRLKKSENFQNEENLAEKDLKFKQITQSQDDQNEDIQHNKCPSSSKKYQKSNSFYQSNGNNEISLISQQQSKLNLIPPFIGDNKSEYRQDRRIKKELHNSFSNQSYQKYENLPIFEKIIKKSINYEIKDQIQNLDQSPQVTSTVQQSNLNFSQSIQQKQIDSNISNQSQQENDEQYILNIVKKYNKPPISQKKRKKSPLTIDQIQIHEQLGKGKFSKVYKGIVKESQFQVAVKIISKADIEKYQMADLVLQEIKILSYLNHPNIIKLYGVTSDKENIYLIQEYATHGTLYQKLKGSYQQKMTEKQCAIYINQIISALRYMHDFHIIHRDLKPENIMLIYDEIKLVDFGCTCYSPYDTESIICGTIDYVAPEMVNQDCYGCSVDLWSLGILTYELLIGFTPFSKYIEREVIQNQILLANIDYNHNISDVAKDFIRIWLQRMPEHRVSLEMAQQHPFIQSNLQLKLKQIEEFL